MGKVVIVLLLCSLVIATKVVQGETDGPEAVEEWFECLSKKTEKLTKLHFFFHDTIGGKNPTAIPVVKPNASSISDFGTIFIADDPLTVGPEPNSTQLGRAQGSFSVAALKDLSFLMTFTYVFTSGEFNGSTLSVLGRNPIFETYREMTIVGGTGAFRLARGIATAKTYWFNATTSDAIVEYHVKVLHY